MNTEFYGLFEERFSSEKVGALIHPLNLGVFLRILVDKKIAIIGHTKLTSNGRTVVNGDLIRFFIPERYLYRLDELKQSSQGTCISYLLNCTEGRDELARSVYKEFLVDPFSVINDFYRHISRVFHDKDTLVDYDLLDAYLHFLFFQKSYIDVSGDNQKTHFFGNDDELDHVVRTMLEKKQYISFISKLILSMICGSVDDKSADAKFKSPRFFSQFRWVLRFIWFDEQQLNENALCFADMPALDQLRDDILYLYASFLYRIHDIQKAETAVKSISVFASSTFRTKKDAPVPDDSDEDAVAVVSSDRSVINYAWAYCLYANILLHYIKKNTYYLKLSEQYLILAKKILDEAIKAARDNGKEENSLTSGDSGLKARIEDTLYDIYHEKYGDPSSLSRYKEKKASSEEKRHTAPECRLSPSTSGIPKSARNRVRDIRAVGIDDVEPVEHCVTNDRKGRIAASFLESMGDFKILDSDEKRSVEHAVSALQNYGKKCVFAFLSDDETQNLRDCLTILDRLYNYSFTDETARTKLAEGIEIFVAGEYDYLSAMIDASLSDMGEQLYLKVSILDYHRDCAQKLIADAPLFLPCLKGNHPEAENNIVVFGTGTFTAALLKEITAVCYTPNMPAVTVIGENTERLRKHTAQSCPGVFRVSERIERIVPDFIECSPYTESFEFPKGNADTDDSLERTIGSGTYFVVDIGSDSENIRFAMDLRRWLLRSDPGLDRFPFIAVKCSDEKSAYMTARLTVNNKAPGLRTENRYDLFCFGTVDEMYRYERIVNDIYERRALEVHLAYDDASSPQWDVLNAYYSFSYNRDSSKAYALAIVYALFSIGFIRSEADLTRIKSAEWDGGERYRSWIENARNLERISAAEHNRWIGFMLSRGWVPLDRQMVDTYVKSIDNREHKHLLAKIHPFICPWEDFNDDIDQASVLYELKKQVPTLDTPRDATYAIMRKLPQIMTLSLSRALKRERSVNENRNYEL